MSIVESKQFTQNTITNYKIRAVSITDDVTMNDSNEVLIVHVPESRLLESFFFVVNPNQSMQDCFLDYLHNNKNETFKGTDGQFEQLIAQISNIESSENQTWLIRRPLAQPRTRQLKASEADQDQHETDSETAKQ